MKLSLKTDLSRTEKKLIEYRKIPIISPGLILIILFKRLFAGLTFGGPYFLREFCISKLVGLDNKNSSKDHENSIKQLTLTVRGHIFGRAYYWKNICI